MIDNFTDLKTAVTNWTKRADLAGQAEEFIQLGEARLNRELNPVELNTTLTGTINSRTIDVSSLSIDEPISLYLARTGLNESRLIERAPGNIRFITVSGRPDEWARDRNGSTSDNIVFDRELDGAYPFRFRFSQRFSLSDAAPTNWLLTNHPDVYLAAVLVWGGVFTRNSPYATQWQAILNSSIGEIKNKIAQSKRGILVHDEMLQRIGQFWFGVYDEVNIFE